MSRLYDITANRLILQQYESIRVVLTQWFFRVFDTFRSSHFIYNSDSLLNIGMTLLPLTRYDSALHVYKD
jgi:hypothetical protein